MKLTCLGSSSAGNGYLLHNISTCLVIEAGVSISEVKNALGFNIRKIAGVIVSHSHQDHSGKIKEYSSAGIPCYTSRNYLPYKPLLEFRVGEFEILPFPIQHDVECFGFLIRHPEIGQLVFLTDGMYSPYTFRGLNHILIEANYDQEILDKNVLNGSLSPVIRNRIMKNHISLQTCKEFLRVNELSGVLNIILLHLSNGNSNEKRFKSEIERLTGKQVFVADKGLEIDLNRSPF